LESFPKNMFPTHVDFMTPYFYDSDSEKDKNPFYKIVNRPENKQTYTPMYFNIYDYFNIKSHRTQNTFIFMFVLLLCCLFIKTRIII
jgi:hypothetical protein